MNELPLSVIINSGNLCLAIISVKNLLTCSDLMLGIAFAYGHLVK